MTAGAVERGPVAYTSPTTPDVEVIVEAAVLRERLPALLAAPQLGLDIETTGLDPFTSTIRLVQLAPAPDRAVVVDAARVDPRLLTPVLAEAHRFVGHNLAFDLAFLAAAGLPTPAGDRLHDTMLASQLLHAGRAEGQLGPVCKSPIQ